VIEFFLFHLLLFCSRVLFNKSLWKKMISGNGTNPARFSILSDPFQSNRTIKSFGVLFCNTLIFCFCILINTTLKRVVGNRHRSLLVMGKTPITNIVMAMPVTNMELKKSKYLLFLHTHTHTHTHTHKPIAAKSSYI
jgi:hypothetical protein